jgi:hypothetical protein
LAEGLATIGVGLKVSEDIDSKKQRVATFGQGILRVCACKEILKEKKRLCLATIQCFIS